jgi:hypothetical protein
LSKVVDEIPADALVLTTMPPRLPKEGTVRELVADVADGGGTGSVGAIVAGGWLGAEEGDEGAAGGTRGQSSSRPCAKPVRTNAIEPSARRASWRRVLRKEHCASARDVLGHVLMEPRRSLSALRRE